MQTPESSESEDTEVELTQDYKPNLHCTTRITTPTDLKIVYKSEDASWLRGNGHKASNANEKAIQKKEGNFVEQISLRQGSLPTTPASDHNDDNKGNDPPPWEGEKGLPPEREGDHGVPGEARGNNERLENPPKGSRDDSGEGKRNREGTPSEDDERDLREDLSASERRASIRAIRTRLLFRKKAFKSWDKEIKEQTKRVSNSQEKLEEGRKKYDEVYGTLVEDIKAAEKEFKEAEQELSKKLSQIAKLESERQKLKEYRDELSEKRTKLKELYEKSIPMQANLDKQRTCLQKERAHLVKNQKLVEEAREKFDQERRVYEAEIKEWKEKINSKTPKMTPQVGPYQGMTVSPLRLPNKEDSNISPLSLKSGKSTNRTRGRPAGQQQLMNGEVYYPQQKEIFYSNGLYNKSIPPFEDGYSFLCNSRTELECFSRMLFASSGDKLAEMQKISPTTAIFLYCTTTQKLHGIFVASAQANINIDSSAFGGRFPAQIRVKEQIRMKPLPEKICYKIFRGDRNRNGHLSSFVTNQIISAFLKQQNKRSGGEHYGRGRSYSRKYYSPQLSPYSPIQYLPPPIPTPQPVSPSRKFVLEPLTSRVARAREQLKRGDSGEGRTSPPPPGEQLSSSNKSSRGPRKRRMKPETSHRTVVFGRSSGGANSGGGRQKPSSRRNIVLTSPRRRGS